MWCVRNMLCLIELELGFKSSLCPDQRRFPLRASATPLPASTPGRGPPPSSDGRRSPAPHFSGDPPRFSLRSCLGVGDNQGGESRQSREVAGGGLTANGRGRQRERGDRGQSWGPVSRGREEREGGETHTHTPPHMLLSSALCFSGFLSSGNGVCGATTRVSRRMGLLREAYIVAVGESKSNRPHRSYNFGLFW